MTVNRARKIESGSCDDNKPGNYLILVPRITLVFSVVAIGLTLILGGCKSKDKPLSLGYFTEISGMSISKDGNNLLFTGCGHKDYQPCTIYRYEMAGDKLYRYMPRSNAEALHGGRYSPVSERFAFIIFPLNQKVTQKEDLLYEEAQIALANHDGSALQIVTSSKGLKLNPAISYDEKILVFSKGSMSDGGSPLKSQKSRVIRNDLFSVDIRNGAETRLTRMGYYGLWNTHIMPDGKTAVFMGDSPMNLPNGPRADDEVLQKGRNKIVKTALDGSNLDKEPEPFFLFDGGTNMPAVAKDGSIWFKGTLEIQNFIHYYLRRPDGTLKEIDDKLLGEGREGKSLIVLREMTVTPDGSRLMTLTINQDTGQRFIGILDTKTNKYSKVKLPTVAENIMIR